jgi:hypothetical protein
MKKICKIFIIVFLGIGVCLTLAFIIAYFWAKGNNVLFMEKNRDYLIQSSNGNPLVGAKEEKHETNIVIWNQGKTFMFVTLKHDGSVEWNMSTSQGSDVFDWNGDGMIDERILSDEGIKIRQIRIGEKFYNLDIKNGRPYVCGKEVEKVNGEWSFSDD